MSAWRGAEGERGPQWGKGSGKSGAVGTVAAVTCRSIMACDWGHARESRAEAGNGEHTVARTAVVVSRDDTTLGADAVPERDGPAVAGHVALRLARQGRGM